MVNINISMDAFEFAHYIINLGLVVPRDQFLLVQLLLAKLINKVSLTDFLFLALLHQFFNRFVKFSISHEYS